MLDKLAMQIFFRYFSLEKRIEAIPTPQDAINHIVEEMTLNEQDGSYNCRYGMIILDQDEY